MTEIHKQTQDLCYDFTADQHLGTTLSQIATNIIAGLNNGIAGFNKKAIDAIGYDTRSEVTAAIMASITYAQFINAGIITLMTNANLQYVPILNIIFPFLRMQYSDLGVGWYLNIGTVLTAAMKSLAM